MSSVAARLTALTEQYQLHFAEQSRLTRNVSLLDLMIGEAEALAQEADDAARPAALNQRDALLRERAAIEGAQATAGPGGQLAARLFEQVEILLHQSMRQFFAQPVQERRLWVVEDVLAHGRQLREQLAALDIKDAPHAQRLAYLDSRLSEMADVYETFAAHQARANPQAQAAHHALMANSYLAAYATYFFDTPQLACSLPLLDRLLAGLDSVQQALSNLLGRHPELPHVEGNLVALQKERTLWLTERIAIASMQNASDTQERADALSDAAEHLLQTFNELGDGGDMLSVPLADISTLCDRMQAVEAQMQAMARDVGQSQSSYDAAAARDALLLFMRIYDDRSRRQ